MSEFGKRLKEYRRNARLTQRELAKKAGIANSYISKMEKGKFRPPSRDVALGLADALGISEAVKRIKFLSAAGVLSDEDWQGFTLLKIRYNNMGQESAVSDRQERVPGFSQKALSTGGATEESVLLQILRQLGELTAAVAQLKAELAELKRSAPVIDDWDFSPLSDTSLYISKAEKEVDLSGEERDMFMMIHQAFAEFFRAQMERRSREEEEHRR